MSKYIAIIQTGVPIPTVMEKHGDFDTMFIKHMQIDGLKCQTFKVFQSLKFPDTKNLAGIIISGSPSMVTEKLDWSEATIQWLQLIFKHNIPILGVCYGHQLLAKALGGQVDWNPNGRQIGSISMQLNHEAHSDPLFSNLFQHNQKTIEYYATHLQSVTKLPKDVILLGSTDIDFNHCFRYKHNIWGLQFHPEFNAKIIREYIHARSDDIIQEGLNPNEIINNIIENDNGIQLLTLFKQLCFADNQI